MEKVHGCHRLCRPPKGATEVLRFYGGRWSKDNGKPGHAFSCRAKDGPPLAVVCSCDCTLSDFDICVSRKAMDKTCERFRCANGYEARPMRVETWADVDQKVRTEVYEFMRTGHIITFSTRKNFVPAHKVERGVSIAIQELMQIPVRARSRR